ncbi:MAG: hypothetical protein IV086_12760 [Hyphomonadaceae bacterium]|nr:hypothetical protein [Hyphomonadaceae bacterium]
MSDLTANLTAKVAVLCAVLVTTACTPFNATDKELVCETFAVSFRDEGRTAMLHDRQKDIRLTLAWSVFFFEDTYKGSGYTLIVDPEAYLIRPDGSRSGPCGY